MSLFYFTSLKESNGDEVMKNKNVQHEVDYYQKNEKIEDQCPHVCTSVRECNPPDVPFVVPWHMGVLEDHFEHEAVWSVLLLLVPDLFFVW